MGKQEPSFQNASTDERSNDFLPITGRVSKTSNQAHKPFYLQESSSWWEYQFSGIGLKVCVCVSLRWCSMRLYFHSNLSGVQLSWAVTTSLSTTVFNLVHGHLFTSWYKLVTSIYLTLCCNL